MALVFMEGFDHISEPDTLGALKGWVVGGVGIGSSTSWGTVGRISGYCLQFNVNAANSGINAYKFFPSSYSTVYVGFAFQQQLAVHSNVSSIIRIRSGSTLTCQVLQQTPSGRIRITNAGGTTIADSTTPISLGVWYFVEVKLVIAGASGTVETRINGAA